jgi:putative aminopeptidase FrvX
MEESGTAAVWVDKGAERPLIAVYAHIDEIGLLVTHIDDNGFLQFVPLGGWDPQILQGQSVQVLSEAGPVPGVLGKKPLWHFPEDERQKVFSIEQMRIDIGARDRGVPYSVRTFAPPAVHNASAWRLS